MKISVITVTYNCAAEVADCLLSVRDQTYPHVEHIVIDGGSTDGTVQIINGFGSHLGAFVSEPDSGIYDAMNKGIALATGDIIGFLNADDFYENKRVLATVASCFSENPMIDACYADLVYVRKYDVTRSVRLWRSKSFVTGSFSKGWSPPHPTFFVFRSIYERFGSFSSDYSIAADVELMMRFLEVYKIRSKYVPELWVRMRTGGVSNKSFKNVWTQNTEVLSALESHGLAANAVLFFVSKLWLRFLQFVLRPTL